MDEKLIRLAEGITPDNLDSACATLVACAIISTEEATQIRTHIMKEERNQIVKEKHNHKIYQGSDGKWYTYIKVDGKRKKIKRNTEDEVKDVLLKLIQEDEIVTISDVFYEWLNHQLELKAISKSTYNRYKATFIRHMVHCGIDKKHIDQVSANDWIMWIEDEIPRVHLNAKGYSGLMLIVRAILRYAKRKGLITYNLSDVCDNIMKRPYKTHKSDESQVFNKDDLDKLKYYLASNPSVQNLSLLLMIVTGMRVGELATLKFSDFLSPTVAEIQRTETCYKGEDGKYHYDVKDSPKTEAGFRKIIIPSDYAWIVGMIRAFIHIVDDNGNEIEPEYICTNKRGKRLTTQSLRSKMYRVCESAGIEKKSTHKARKTYISTLLDNGVGKATVTSLAGHVDINTTFTYYHKDRRSDAEKQKLIDNIVEFRQAVGS